MDSLIRTLGGTLEREIELNKIIGEMAGTLRGISILYDEKLTDHSHKKIKDLLDRYDRFFEKP